MLKWICLDYDEQNNLEFVIPKPIEIRDSSGCSAGMKISSQALREMFHLPVPSWQYPLQRDRILLGDCFGCQYHVRFRRNVGQCRINDAARQRIVRFDLWKSLNAVV
jgi:hypothetical protein